MACLKLKEAKGYDHVVLSHHTLRWVREMTPLDPNELEKRGRKSQRNKNEGAPDPEKRYDGLRLV